MHTPIFLFVSLLFLSTTLSAQTPERLLADSLAREGIRLMDEGRFDVSVQKLEEAKRLFSGTHIYDYEIGLAYYMQEQWGAAAKSFKQSIRQGCEGQCYKMLGNAYDLDGNRKKAVKTYEKGIAAYPDYGPLYLEIGVVENNEGNYNAALDAWEKGIERDPDHASNYYYATRVFAGTEEKIWAMLYGETFLNLEFNTPRSEEISGLLFTLYNDVYTAETDTSGEYHLTERGFTIYLDPKKGLDLGNGKDFHLLPFAGEFAMSFTGATAGEYLNSPLDLAGIHRARVAFLDNYFADDGTNPYEYALLQFLRDIQTAGHLEAYDYLVFRMGDQVEFDMWYEKHEAEFNDFTEWFDDKQLAFRKFPHSRLGF